MITEKELKHHRLQPGCVNTSAMILNTLVRRTETTGIVLVHMKSHQINLKILSSAGEVEV